MVNGRPGVGQAFHDLGSRSHEKIMFSPFSRCDIQRQTRRDKNVRCVDLEIYISEKYWEYIWELVSRILETNQVEQEEEEEEEVKFICFMVNWIRKKKSKFLKNIICNNILDRLIKSVIDLWIGLR